MSTGGKSNTGSDTGGTIAAICMGLVLAVSLVALIAAPIATMLSGRGFARAVGGPTGAVSSVLSGDIDAAFDPAPPLWLFLVVAVVLLAGLGVLALKVAKFALSRSGHRGGAQWAGARGEQTLVVPEEPKQRPDQLTAGRSMTTGKLLAGKKCISATCFGVPGSGKTVGLLTPNALEWQGPLVITAAKGSDLDAIYARRRELGPVWIIAPGGLAGHQSHCWSPVDYATDAKAADRMAEWLADASSSASDPRAKAWVDMARTVVKAVLLAANASGGGIAAFRRWCSLGDAALDEVVTVLLAHGHDEAAEDYTAAWGVHEAGIGSIKFTLSVLVRVYADEEVRATAAGTDFTPEELIDRCGTVCLVASPSDAERLAPLMTAITASIIHGAEARYQATGKPLSPALGLLIDEAGNMFRYPKLPNVLTTARGMGMMLLTVWHDLSQLRAKLGREAAGTVMSASGMRLLLPGVADLDTLEQFSRLMGRTEIKRKSTTHASGSTSTSYSIQDKELATVNDLRELPDNSAVVLYGNLRPTKVKLRPFYLDPALMALSTGPAAPTSTAKAAAAAAPAAVSPVIPPRPPHPPTAAPTTPGGGTSP